MRLRNVPGADAYLTAHPLVIKNETRYRGTWKETFQNPENPIHIEIGMGKGQFLLTLAKENPSINYIGIERYSSAVSYTHLDVYKRQSSDRPISIGCPVSLVWVLLRDIFSVPSNTWMIALSL